MYDVILFLHNLLRWVILAVVVDMALVSWWSYFNKTSYNKFHRIFALSTMIFIDLQFTLGIAFFLGISPVSSEIIQSGSGFMKNPALRFFGLEHVFLGIIVLVLSHIANVRGKKAVELAKHRNFAIFYTIIAILVLMMIPWPGLPWGRPLFR